VTLTPAPPTATPTPCIFTPATVPTYSGDVVINLKLKFQGITKKIDSKYNTQLVKIKLTNTDTGNSSSRLVNVSQNGSAIWEGQVKFAVPAGNNYKVFIKGPKHIQKKICQNNPTETLPGFYQCEDGTIKLIKGTNTLDFSNIIQIVGDLGTQDGIVNSYDLALITNNLGKKDCAILKSADLNLDGIVDTQDYSLVLSALAIKLDEN